MYKNWLAVYLGSSFVESLNLIHLQDLLYLNIKVFNWIYYIRYILSYKSTLNILFIWFYNIVVGCAVGFYLFKLIDLIIRNLNITKWSNELKEYLLISYEFFKSFQVIKESKIDFSNNLVEIPYESSEVSLNTANSLDTDLLMPVFKPVSAENINETIEPLTESWVITNVVDNFFDFESVLE